MKRMVFMLLGAIMVCATQAQVVEQGESALVYYSPKTAISVDFTYTVESFEAGIYAEYAEDMLGIANAVTETKTVYTLQGAQIGTATGTDLTRPHKVRADAGIPLLLHINDKGLLVGYNAPETQPNENSKPRSNSQKESAKEKRTPSDVAPFSDEVLKAATPLAQAAAVAQQIFHLRETRLYLLSGEVEHAPADGVAMRLVMQELDEQEQALTELFTGKTSKRTEHKKVRMEPETEQQLYFFSAENGFTDGDNIDADTIVVAIAGQRQEAVAPVEEENGKKKKSIELSPIVYNLPGKAKISVTCQGNELAKRTLNIAQFGIDVALPKSMFTGKELPKIVFNERTGAIISISK